MADVNNLVARSLRHFESGLKAFETVHDEANLALLHSNSGRLMRLRALIHSKVPSQERDFHNKELSSYQKALQVLGSRKTNPVIWDAVTWDLSTTLYNIATLLQDYPPTGNKVRKFQNSLNNIPCKFQTFFLGTFSRFVRKNE